MYPSLGGPSPQGPSQAAPAQPAASGSGGASYYPTVGVNSLRGSDAGPGQQACTPRDSSATQHAHPPNGAPPQHSPMLRVQIAEQFRTHPPVAMSPGLDAIPRAQTSFDFDLERRLLAEEPRSSAQAAEQSSKNFDDPFRHVVESYLALGYDQEEVALALALHSGRAEQDQEKVVNFCVSFRQLKSMGFTPAHIVGALALHADDIAAATEACLSCQG